jgi:undecaprenyl-diphosphatase
MRGRMALWFAALLGVVQGLTEFIPVSSNAHLRITAALLGQSDKHGAEFTAVLQLGSIVAVVAYFAKDLIQYPKAMFRDPKGEVGRMPWLIAFGSIPIVFAGLFLKKLVEGDLRSLYVIAGAMLVIGIVMWVIDRGASERRTITSITYRDAMLVGLAQTMALIPGVSRSGSTICMLLLLGLNRRDAARFSFLLGIPAITGAGILESKPVFENFDLAPIVVGVVVAGIVSYAAIAWLIRWLGTHKLVGFAAYRVVAGLALLVALGMHVLDPLLTKDSVVPPGVNLRTDHPPLHVSADNLSDRGSR